MTFDPQTMFTHTLDEIELAISTVEGNLSRLRRLRDMIADEFEAMQRRAASFEIFTEAEAAAMLKLGRPDASNPDQAEKRLAALRRDLKLPHFTLGKSICYTRSHLDAICAILTVNASNQVRPAVLKHAA